MGVIKKYEAPAKTEAYAGDVAELIAAGDGAAFELVTPTERVEGKRGGSAEAERAKFQAAARKAGYTARIMETEPVGDDTRFVFVLTERRKSASVSDEAPAE